MQHQSKRKFNRKNFLKITAGLAAAAGLTKSSQAKPDKKTKVNPNPVKVYVAAVESDVASAVNKVAEAAGDFSWLKKGQSVFIKPVVNSGNVYPATTNPEAIAAMIRLLKEKGAGRVIVGDMSGIEHLKFFEDETEGSTRELMKKSGILKAVKAAGGEPYAFEEHGWQSFYVDQTTEKKHWPKGILMPKILQAVDHIVLMPRCSRHVIAGSTLGMKAAVGYWRTDSRLEYHYNADTLHERTAEGNRARVLVDKQRLVLSTADKILATFGPDDGYTFKPKQGIVFASESVVAHDMVSLAWLVHNRHLIPDDEKDTFMDSSSFAAKVANSYVVSMLSHFGKAIISDSVTKDDLNTIWDDLVLNHAYKIFGGIPQIEIVNVDGKVAAKTIQSLAKLTKVR